MSKNYHHYTGSVTRNMKTIITHIFSWHLCFVPRHHTRHLQATCYIAMPLA